MRHKGWRGQQSFLKCKKETMKEVMDSMDTEVSQVPKMNDSFDTEVVSRPAKIKVIGVGGGGCNAVSSMAHDAGSFQGVEFVCINTDQQALTHTECDNRIAIGVGITRGLGAGSDPAIGRAAIEESKEAVLPVVQDADMVFITAGMGGGTGTGAAPVVAKMAQEANALTVAVVTKPFAFEGARRMARAVAGIEELSKAVDAIIIIPNDNMLNMVDDNLTRQDAFKLSDNVLAAGVRGISEIITMTGEQNVDFADVQSIMKNSGTALLGIGAADGENRAVEAARNAISSALWESDINGATGVLFNVVASDTFTMKELQDAANEIYQVVDPDANIIFGSVTDNSVGDEVRITVVATGFQNKSDVNNTIDEEEFMQEPHNEEVFFDNPIAGSIGNPIGGSPRHSDDFMEPAILRRSRPSLG